ncbi:ranscription-associated recombination protein [Vairimorpha ceranae]|uniref:Ranscription-associated recombination protein n=1 Tax=Vairimorpha ceranae TaxID=40302 RepID=A0A0F9WTR3_9MICR|nr:ranscription-associated recombination protein [Vairimorpha ceranae]KAF5141475.1 hypothetical protein G9O61_00g003380 [Vairimorpha ceranae]KKO76208.1 ranscription-associated recombination protein [Vairimorpha ceranae]
MNSRSINKFIKDKNFRKLSVTFKPFIPKHNYYDITPPFDHIINKHVFYTKNKNFNNAVEVLKTACVLFDCQCRDEASVIFKYIIKNCIFHIETDEDIRSLIKITLEIYKHTKYHTLANILFKLYFRIQNLELAYNFLLITSNNRIHKKDYYIYNLYKGLLLFYKGDLEESSKCINLSFKSKKIRKEGFLLFFIINLINNKYIKTEDEMLLNLKIIVREGLFTHIYNILDELEGFFVKFNISLIVRNYLPQLCFANLIKRIFYLKNEDYKLNLEYLLEVIDLDYEELISMVCCVIESNLVKGYISVNKNMMVFSRRDPFPLKFF